MLYLNKLVKSGDYKQACGILEEIIMHIESLPPLTQINGAEKSDCELLASFFLLFFLYRIGNNEVYETMLEKVETVVTTLISKGDLTEPPFAFEYFTILNWQSKSMDRQAKEKLHLMGIHLTNRINQIRAGGSEPAHKKLKMSEDLFTLFSYDNNIGDDHSSSTAHLEAKLKLTYFELNRLYMKTKEYRSGYKVLYKLVEVSPLDVEVLLRTAKY